MKNKLAIVYGSAILLLVLIHIFTFFSNRKSDKPTVPAVSVKTLMNALNVHCFAFDIEGMTKQIEKGVFFEVLDGDKVVQSKQMARLTDIPADKTLFLFVWKTEEFFNFSFVNGGRKYSWKEKFPVKSTFEMWKGTNGVLKFGEIFYHGVPESDINAMVFTHGKGRKFRIVINKDTFPPKTQP